MTTFIIFHSILIASVSFFFLCNVQGQCHNNCRGNGLCTKWAECECFEGWEGFDCSRRTCPKGRRLTDIAYNIDQAHQSVICSGRGTCDYLTGLCKCDSGYSGHSCERSLCPNSCNNRGKCISLRTAASDYDGWSLNHTTTYNLWDADLVYGCQCDPGWYGFDCSERKCEVGTDPRLYGNKHEIVTLTCSCTANCGGLFKLRFLGQIIPTYFKPNSTGEDIAKGLMSVRGTFGNNAAHSSLPIFVGTNLSISNNSICMPSSTTNTYITFRMQAGDVPAISLYSNRISGGSLYFKTSQTLSCDCTVSCNGTFRLSYDGEMTSRISIFNNGTAVQKILSNMKTIKASLASVVNGVESPICIHGQKTNHSIILHSFAGNLPRFGLLSSAVSTHDPTNFATVNATILTITSNDGRDERVYECSGVGSCNRDTSTCKCPYGWTNDDDGPCSRLQINSSDWQGIARCPGTLSYDGLDSDWTAQPNVRYFYASFNPTYLPISNLTRSHNKTDTYNYNITSYNISISVIERFEWKPYTAKYENPPPFLPSKGGEVILTLSSNKSAGPMALDQAGGWLYYADNHPIYPFIGRLQLNDSYTDSSWLSVTEVISGLTLDTHFRRRRLYFTTVGVNYIADGKLYWCYLDALPAVAYDLTAVIGQINLVDPSGIAVHYYQDRIYWLDKNLTAGATVMRSSGLTGGSFQQVFLYRDLDNVTTPANVTDLKIDFRNNTAYFIDTHAPTAIIRTSLDFPSFINVTYPSDHYRDFFTVSVLCQTIGTAIGHATHMFLDSDDNMLIWSDALFHQINFYNYNIKPNATSGHVFSSIVYPFRRIGHTTMTPVGLLLDDGMGPPRWAPYQECYGKGRCLGLLGYWRCECFSGFSGDCQSRACPLGPAWFAEPIVDDVAHDVLVECSNMGRCNRFSGMCECYPGYEGAACERSNCRELGTTSSTAPQCNGNGRCLSMRQLAENAKNSYLEPSPVVYGSTPHNPSTWDADMIYGCLGDSYGYIDGYHNITTFEGMYLDELQCPPSFNMRALEQSLYVYNNNTQNYTIFREVQGMRCSADNGTFVLNFRGKSTIPIKANATVSRFYQTLMDLHVMGNLNIDLFGSSDRICDGSAMNITFLTELTNIPLIAVHASNLTGGADASVYFWRVQEGKGKLLECGGHGDCDRETGQCNCWSHWGSSNGLGALGTRGDCGHNLVY